MDPKGPKGKGFANLLEGDAILLSISPTAKLGPHKWRGGGQALGDNSGRKTGAAPAAKLMLECVLCCFGLLSAEPSAALFGFTGFMREAVDASPMVS